MQMEAACFYYQSGQCFCHVPGGYVYYLRGDPKGRAPGDQHRTGGSGLLRTIRAVSARLLLIVPERLVLGDDLRPFAARWWACGGCPPCVFTRGSCFGPEELPMHMYPSAITARAPPTCEPPGAETAETGGTPVSRADLSPTAGRTTRPHKYKEMGGTPVSPGAHR